MQALLCYERWGWYAAAKRKSPRRAGRRGLGMLTSEKLRTGRQ